MVEAFKSLHVNVACLGNHDLDFGLEKAEKLIRATETPWLISNIQNQEGEPIAGLKKMHALETQGFKLGLMGFADKGWLELLSIRVPVSELNYKPYLDVLPKLSRELKNDGCDLLIALNHMHYEEDEIMATNASLGELDLLLGGHDHLFLGKLVEETGVYIQKSGTDFENFSNLTILFDVAEDDYEEFNERVHQEPKLCMANDYSHNDRSKTLQLYYCERQ